MADEGRTGSEATADIEARLGAHLRAARIERSLTQADLADRANVSLGTVKSLERGRGSTVTTLVKVLRALDLTDWVDALAPPEPAFNPLDLLARQRRRPAVRSRVGRPRPRREADDPRPEGRR